MIPSPSRPTPSTARSATWWATRLATLIAVLVAMAAPALAADFVISSGTDGGYYDGVGRRLASVLRQEGRSSQHRSSQGSIENLEHLDDPESPVNVGLAQADAVRHYLDQNPEFVDDLVVMDDIGRECVTLITRRNGGIAGAADLKEGGHGVLNVESPTSGAAVTYEYMSRMEPAFRNTPVAHRDTVEALLQMRMGPSGEKIAATMVVKRPRIVSPELEIVLQNPKLFRIAPVLEEDFQAGKLPDGKPVYSFERVQTGFGKDRKVEYDTLCTRGLLVASASKLGKESRRILAETMLRSGDLIAPGR